MIWCCKVFFKKLLFLLSFWFKAAVLAGSVQGMAVEAPNMAVAKFRRPNQDYSSCNVFLPLQVCEVGTSEGWRTCRVSLPTAGTEVANRAHVCHNDCSGFLQWDTVSFWLAQFFADSQGSVAGIIWEALLIRWPLHGQRFSKRNAGPSFFFCYPGHVQVLQSTGVLRDVAGEIKVTRRTFGNNCLDRVPI